MVWSSIAIIIVIAALVSLRVRRAGAPERLPRVGDAIETRGGLRGEVVDIGEVALLVQLADVAAPEPHMAAAAGAAAPGPTAWVDAAAVRSVQPRTTGPPTPPPASADSGPEPPGADGFLGRLARLVSNARDVVAWGWLIVVIACLPLSSTAVHELTAGGFLPPGEARDTQEELTGRFGLPASTVTYIIDAPPAEVDEAVQSQLRRLAQIPHVAGAREAVASTDGTGSMLEIGFTTGPDIAQDSLPEITEALAIGGLEDVRVAGLPALYADIAHQTEKDLLRAEMIGIPAAMVVLVVVFGSFTAAALPLAVGVATVVVTLALIHLVALTTDISIYVLNIAAMLGLGIGIDYALLAVSRFRDELGRGATVDEAVTVTVQHAGRAAAVSGLAVAAGLASLAIMPIAMMKSIALAGVIVVGIAVAASITLLPALLSIIGRNIDRFQIRRPSTGEQDPNSIWARLVRGVMRHAALTFVVGLGILVVLAWPTLNMTLDMPSGGILPQDAPSELASAELLERFDEVAGAPSFLVVDGDDPGGLDTFEAQLNALPDSGEVERLVVSDGAVVFSLTSESSPMGGEPARELLAEARELDTTVTDPDAGPLRATGQPQGEVEFIGTIEDWIPRVVAVVFVATFFVLLYAFRSIALPLKALLLDSISILAALGVVVAIFELGIGVNLLGTDVLGYTIATIPVLIFCVLFGLSMDYEVFMLAQVAERHQRGQDTTEATVGGVAHTAPLVTGAAAILIVIGLGFATAGIVIVKQIGVALAVALFLDATVVRALLLPSAMKLLGDANWWLPKGLGRWLPSARWSH